MSFFVLWIKFWTFWWNDITLLLSVAKIWCIKLRVFFFWNTLYLFHFLLRDAVHKRGLCCHAVSVCLSVTFVSCAKTNKDIFEIFSPSGSDTILVFPYQRGADIPTGTSLTGALNATGYDKMTTFSQISRCISETVIVRWAHAARQFVSIKFSFHPYNI